MFRLANPNVFLRNAQMFLPYLVAGFVVCLGAGLYYALYASPADYQQKEFVRIMYVHVPSAWMSMACYVAMSVFSISYISHKMPLADLLAKNIAVVGALFTANTIITGMLWGRPTWGVYWVWDARLTSVAILLFIYMAHYYIRAFFKPESKAKFIAAVFAIVGLINIPIIKFSVDWWASLHQPASILRSGGLAIHESMLPPLFLMFAAFIFFACIVVALKVSAELRRRKLRPPP